MSEFCQVTDFLPEVRIAAPRCPEPALLRILLESMIEFCQETTAWRYEHPAIDIQAGISVYQLDPPLLNSHVHSILVACDQGKRPLKVAAPKRGQVELLREPTADIAGGINLLLSIKPNWNTDEVSQVLFDDYREAIIHGAKERLYGQVERPWGSAEQSLKFRQLFQLGIARAKAAQDRGRMHGQPRMRRRGGVR